MKVNFFCIGAQKAGTTLLHDILIQHPDIYLPPDKEAHFFDVNERYEKGLDYFETFFSTYSGQKRIGNINPNLQVENRSIDRIIDSYGNKEVKIIFILRDPVKRMYSHYLMSKKRGYEKLTFQEALNQESHRIKNPKNYKKYYTNELGHFEKDHLGYSLRSHYLKTLKHLHQRIPQKNIKVVFFEEFLGDKQNTITDLLNFIEVDNNFEFDLSIKSNPAQKSKSILVSKFLITSSPLKSVLKKITPTWIRLRIKNFVKKINLKELSEEEKKLSPFIYSSLRKEFDSEVEELEKFLNRRIDFWEY
ncbi:sulfotransferase family protein [Flagellimonas zhangzhouensis]|uniref:Sulfotransferase domain-containing protein n=1 Tax=Flagellimonas zhangzhouensis TaxID=1073328 RepID=A0A1H2UR41_9FLAO|nr:sulfotransferase [Allomuricauda zhangzhouensis]SDQ14578.1 Sulfotransferase domain-containing protein [Allomuricauda zhangzhouensis]SDW58597.1 Sulfotransferase domain-containing protein [Allomuricauda zhangzhouensis]